MAEKETETMISIAMENQKVANPSVCYIPSLYFNSNKEFLTLREYYERVKRFALAKLIALPDDDISKLAIFQKEFLYYGFLYCINVLME